MAMHDPRVGALRKPATLAAIPSRMDGASKPIHATVAIVRTNLMRPARVHRSESLPITSRMVAARVALRSSMAERLQRVSRAVDRVIAGGQFFPMDEGVRPTMFKYATVNEIELDQIRSIRSVIRLGHVRRIDEGKVVLDHGSVPMSQKALYVHCASAGLKLTPGVPIFGANTITLQPIRAGQSPFAAAITGYVEATREDVDEKNKLCPQNPYMDTPSDLARLTLSGMGADYKWSKHPDIMDWLDRARLNSVRGVLRRVDVSLRERIVTSGNLSRANGSAHRGPDSSVAPEKTRTREGVYHEIRDFAQMVSCSHDRRIRAESKGFQSCECWIVARFACNLEPMTLCSYAHFGVLALLVLSCSKENNVNVQGGAGGEGGSLVPLPDCEPGAAPGIPARGPSMVQVPAPTADGTGRCFWVDSTEVTNEQYEAFVAAPDAKAGASPGCEWNTSLTDNACAPAALLGTVSTDPSHPTVCVDHCDAVEFCKWAGKELCAGKSGSETVATSSSWYAACLAGNLQNVYPYGDKYDSSFCSGDKNPATCGTSCTEAVGTNPACSSADYDVFDMSGNVEEWVDECVGNSPDDDCNVRGGSFASDATQLACPAYFSYARSSAHPARGFRCCAKSP